MIGSGRRIIVKTLAQAAIFEYELKGQFSDGYWENSNPWEHWKEWCAANVEVGETIGRNFCPRKDNYGLHSLIQYIGDRMQFIGALAIAHPVEVTTLMQSGGSIPESALDWSNYAEWGHSSTGQWAVDTRNRWVEAGLTLEMLRQVEDTVDEIYPRKQLRADLTTIKKAMKTWA